MATNLMFRGLFLADSTLTEVKPDLAESYEVSDDGLVYTITLKDGLKWSDGEALTCLLYTSYRRLTGYAMPAGTMPIWRYCLEP